MQTLQTSVTMVLVGELDRSKSAKEVGYGRECVSSCSNKLSILLSK